MAKTLTYSNRAAPFSAFPLWWRNGLQAWEIAAVAPWVAAHRILRMANAGAVPSARDSAEFWRMGQEKGEAFAAAGSGMATLWYGMLWDFTLQSAARWWQLALNPWQAFARSGSAWPVPLAFTPQLRARDTHDAARLMSKALVPVHRRVAANAKRLGRVR
ncbi:MAG TPA: polyhydroxyalkanoate granule-associated phasin [Burkholderiaceae bacterium]|nr:polyhydroxyalkanoate granule-associated phasin [Burkholderiaceae bacterium]